MTTQNQDLDENAEEMDQKKWTEEEAKVHTVPLPISKPKIPFSNVNRFGKGMQGNNVNNRQRPGRAANRWR